MGKLQIELLGASFSAQASEDDAYLAKLLSYYREITESIAHSSGVKDPIKISILSGIALVDELYKEKQKTASLLHQTETEKKAEQITRNIIEKISGALE
ncbi:cell division protein ZapA [Treponema sp.]|uniref:cell division protein ZapA n=1 Tax=Treponema sp. TaxID=166 RepID=UPI003EFC7B41